MKHFGTDGIRGKADQFTSEFLAAIIKGLIDYAGPDIKILIGGDTRESSESILSMLGSILEDFGITYGNVGILSTPAINYCFGKMGYDIAIDVTASHNPYTDNGIKIFEQSKSGPQKLCADGRAAIESSLQNIAPYAISHRPCGPDLHDQALGIYRDHLIAYIGNADFSALHIGIDCANGATSPLGKSVFESFGAKAELINASNTYTTEINNHCGSTHLESLQSLVLAKQLDFGIAFDGDGDRCLLIDQNGAEIDGDQILAILSDFLKLDSLAVTVMTNQGLINWAKENHIALTITPVGDSNVAAAMREKDIPLGGEQSGHIILPGEQTGDGMLTALMICKAVSASGQILHNLAATMIKLPQIVTNLSASPAQKEFLKTSNEVKSLLQEFDRKLVSVSGRLLVRPSGTEDLVRITLWGDDLTSIQSLSGELKERLEKLLS